jgi:hypothetical protein
MDGNQQRLSGRRRLAVRESIQRSISRALHCKIVIPPSLLA